MLALLGVGSSLQAQEQTPTALREDNEAIRRLAERIDPGGWIYFREDVDVSVAAFWDQLGEAMGLSAPDEMRLVKQETDDLGMRHSRFQQYYRGIKVEWAEYFLHEREGTLTLAHGQIVEGLELPSQPEVSEAEALSVALEAIGATVYAWQDEDWEAAIKADRDNETATYYPQGRLTLRSATSEQWLVAEDYRLCWYFEVRTLAPSDDYGAWIDALSGEVVQVKSLNNNCNGVTGTANTLYYGNRSLDMRERGWPNNDFRLEDCNKDIETRIYERDNNLVERNWSGFDKVDNNSSTWGNTNSIETTAHWATQQAWDYFHSAFGYDSWDGNGTRIRVATRLTNVVQQQNPPFNRVEVDFANAFYRHNDEMILFGTRNGFSLATLDIVGHEFTHGVVKYTAGLENEREPGSIDEGYADIFGTMVERHGDWANLDWTIGEDANWILRDMENPNNSQTPQPAFWSGPNWRVPVWPNCAVPNFNINGNCWTHHNNGVLNRCFNLLVGSNNPTQLGITVHGIGYDKAAQIAFRALRYYLGNWSWYEHARTAWINAATDLYGSCSIEVLSTQDAWAAVNRGAASNMCVFLNGPAGVCDYLNTSFDPMFTGNSVNGATYGWSLPTGWLSYTSGAGNKYLHLTHWPTSPDFGQITVTAYWNGRSASRTQWVQINNCSGGGIQLRAAQAPALTKIKVFPNPAQEAVLVEVDPSLVEGQLTLVDGVGREVKQVLITQAQQKIPLHHLPPGLYYVSVEKGHLRQQATLVLQPQP